MKINNKNSHNLIDLDKTQSNKNSFGHFQFNEGLTEDLIASLGASLDNYINSDYKQPFLLIAPNNISKYALVQQWASNHNLSLISLDKNSIMAFNFDQLLDQGILLVEDYNLIPVELRKKLIVSYGVPRIFISSNLVALQPFDKNNTVILDIFKELTEGYIKEKMDDKKIYFEAYITNLGKYNEGELIGEWVSFPISPQEFEEVLTKIGITYEPDEFGNVYEEWFVTDYDTNLDSFDWRELGEYPSYEELQEYSEKLKSVDNIEAVNNVMEVVRGLDEAIDGLANGTIYYYPGIKDEASLASYFINEIGGIDKLSEADKENYFDYEMFGRDASFDDWDGMSAAEYWCGDENASDYDIGRAIADDVGFKGISNADAYFDYAEFGNALTSDNFYLTSDGAVELT